MILLDKVHKGLSSFLFQPQSAMFCNGVMESTYSTYMHHILNICSLICPNFNFLFEQFYKLSIWFFSPKNNFIWSIAIFLISLWQCILWTLYQLSYYKSCAGRLREGIVLYKRRRQPFMYLTSALSYRVSSTLHRQDNQTTGLFAVLPVLRYM